MKFLKGLLVGLALLVAVMVGTGFLLPSTVHVERSVVIQSPPATVFTLLNGFKRFQEWSPWRKYDPNAVMTTGGADTGVGARQSWASAETGDGGQEIIESKPYEKIRLRLQFADGGSDDVYLATYTLKPQERGTLLTWSFDADYGNNLVGRYFGLLMERFLGPDYEEGLSNLKALSEKIPYADFSALEIAVVDVKPQTIAYVSGTTTTEADAVSTAYAVAFSKVLSWITAHKLRQTGSPPLAISRRWDEKAAVHEYDTGIPVEAAVGDGAAADEVRLATTYAGKALRVVHRGSHKTLGPTYDALFAYVAVNGYAANGNVWEEFVSNPATTAEADLVTQVYLPVK